ncbi:MAG: hypothetical protein ABIO91_02415 [Pyrinomonadaceae bacterium]
MQKFAILISCFLFFSGSVSAQEEQSGMIKSAKGILVVWNEPGNYFSIEIRGKTILPGQQRMMFQVDGRFFQIQTVDKKAFLKNLNNKTLDDKAILAAHREWERDYISGALKRELRVESEWLKLPGGQDILAWSYAMPKVADRQTVMRQLYLAVVKRDHVLLLNTALANETEAKDAKDLLFQTLITLKPSDKPLSLQKAKEQVMNEN